MSDHFPEYQVYQLRTLSQKIFPKWKNFQSKHCRIFHCRLSKIGLHDQTVIYHRLTVFHQLFSWTSVGLSKCPINKMTCSKGHLNVWAVPWVQHDIIQSLLQLLFQTVLESEAKSLLPTVQFDFSWTLEISNRQNDRFERLSDSLKSSVSTICIS